MSTKPQPTDLTPAPEPPTMHTSAPRSQAPPADPLSMEVDKPATLQAMGTNISAPTMQLQASISIAPAPSPHPPTTSTLELWGWEVGAYAVMHPTTTCEICHAYLAHTDVSDATFAVAMHAHRHHEEHLASNGHAVLIMCCKTIERWLADCTNDLVCKEKHAHCYKANRDEARAELVATRRSLDRATVEHTCLLGLLYAYEMAPLPAIMPAPPSCASTSSSACAPHGCPKSSLLRRPWQL
ncbi:hypothetical protein EWM64_g4964 [Hericium alpestre]|uniref:Uncharacterized protein n=1 Tax=Hericium alpestre TaxID=135208 RepID=A0A4Y9ZY92_9AGAM|nr:hypothetical protein EWM64_g4964 [Hericium alpestre]